MADSKYSLIIGLGNPGKKYEFTYHNAGFLVLDRLAKEFTQEPNWNKENIFIWARTSEIILIKPLTFMNKSGEAVREAMKKFKVGISRILVVHDDSDLGIGKVRFSSNRGSAGHHGIDSITESLGTKKFARLRIGIRSDESTSKANSIVLARIRQRDLKEIYSAVSSLKEKLIVNE